ncbi:MAG: MBL fold metallo-hydrolase [Anaerolineae bacterium]
MSKLSRRQMLKAMGISTVGVAVGSQISLAGRPALAQSAPTGTPLGFYSFALGAMQLTVIRDAAREQNPAILGANAPEGGVDEILKANNVPSPINATFNVLLARNGDKTILFDTGNGAGNGGALLATLGVLGIAPDSITDVVFSHFHPDHVGGALTDGKPTFANAMYHFPQPEFDFVDGTVIENVPEAQRGLFNNSKAIFAAAGDAGKFNTYAQDTEILPGIMSIAASGHTPGHTAFMLQSDNARMMHIVDAAINSIVSLARPDWFAAFDANGEQASETRKKLFSEAASGGIRVFGYHFPFPGTGYVAAEGEGFRFIPYL